MSRREFSPLQEKVLELLSDGLPHKREEVVAIIKEDDELSTDKTFRNCLQLIRNKLRPKGQDIICQFLYRSLHYRHIRLLHSPNDGYR